MDAQISYSDSIANGMAKILEGSQEIAAERARVLAITLSTDEACVYFNCSLPTLLKRRKIGLVKFVVVRGEPRYFLPEKEGSTCSK